MCVVCGRTEEKQRLDSLVLDFEKTIADKSGAMDTLQSELKLVMAQLNDSQRRSEEAEHMVAQLEKKRCAVTVRAALGGFHVEAADLCGVWCERGCREEDRQRLAELTSQYEANLEQKSEALESLEQRAASDEERIAALTATLGAIEGKLKTQAAEYQALMRQERAALEKEIDIYQSQVRRTLLDSAGTTVGEGRAFPSELYLETSRSPECCCLCAWLRLAGTRCVPIWRRRTPSGSGSV